MVLRKAAIQIKQFVMKVLILFLPRPESAPEGDEVVTEKGVRKIVKKLFMYLVLGMWMSNILSLLRHIGILQSFELHTISSDFLDSAMYLSIPERLLLGLALLYYGIMPLLRYMYKWLRVTGIIYAISAGFILSCGMGIVKLHLIAIILLSIAFTAVLSLLPLYLLKYRHRQLPKQLACITYVIFAFITLGGSVLNILNLIPYVRILTGYLLSLSGNVGVIIALNVIKVIVAFLFMFLAYNRMDDYSKRGVSRKYEWLAAFTGFYTVALIIVKMFALLTIFFN